MNAAPGNNFEEIHHLEMTTIISAAFVYVANIRPHQTDSHTGVPSKLCDDKWFDDPKIRKTWLFDVRGRVNAYFIYCSIRVRACRQMRVRAYISIPNEENGISLYQGGMVLTVSNWTIR